MKFSKKHVLIGIICLISAVLSNVYGISAIILYLAFCMCSVFLGLKSKKAFGLIMVLFFGLVALPVLNFVYSMLTASFAKTPLASVLILFVQTCIYFGLFILVNSWIRKEKFTFSLITGILTLSCIVVYSVLEGLQEFALFNATIQAFEQGGLINWLNVIAGGNPFVSIISGIMFYVALWCVSVRFIKEN